MWATLSTAQRAKAVQRMTALNRWHESEGRLDAKQAAADAGVSVTRMYEMGKAWRERRSLAALGTFAAAPKTRVGSHDAAIRKVLGGVVEADPRASVRKLALDLEAAVAGSLPDIPSHNTFRRYVELERRRRDREEAAGNELVFDCSACILTPSEDELVTAFVIIDRATQVVLGAALGDVADSRAGYGGAASDAMRRLDRGQFSKLRWVEEMARAEIVAGTDLDAWSIGRERLGEAGCGASVEISTRDGRFGRYLRPATGLRIGTMVLMPSHTLPTKNATGYRRAVAPTSDHQMRLSVEVDEYNAVAMSEMDHGSNLPPPTNLLRLLELMSGG